MKCTTFLTPFQASNNKMFVLYISFPVNIIILGLNITLNIIIEDFVAQFISKDQVKLAISRTSARYVFHKVSLCYKDYNDFLLVLFFQRFPNLTSPDFDSNSYTAIRESLSLLILKSGLS